MRFKGIHAISGTKDIAILGSTGSVGKNALKVIEALGEDFRVAAISAHSNYQLLAEQAKRYRPDVICISDESHYDALRDELRDFGGKVVCGGAGLIEIAESSQIDIVLSAIVGVAGLAPVLAAAKKGKRLAIANKEPLVVAGRLLTETAKANGAEILPVDSEHSAIFQCMQAGCVDEVQRIILTASGGPFRGYSAQQIRDVTLEQALAHPTWNMGPKITVDSATMMNKALEVIEARWLFGLPIEKIEVLIHPESIVHSLVEYVDGSVIAQMGTPDMCLPIQYALTYPKRVKGIANHLKLDELGSLNFERPDFGTFRALRLAFEVAKTGGTACAVFNAANEAAVGPFLDGKISFVNIVEAVEHCLEKHDGFTDASLEELLDADAWAREEVNKCLNQNAIKK